MDTWAWMIIATPSRRRRWRLAVKALVLGGIMLAAGAGLAFAQSTSSGFGSGQVSMTRPNNGTAYTAASVIGPATTGPAVFTFGPMGPTGKDVIITSASLEIDVTAVPGGMTTFTLWLYNVTPPSALTDGQAWVYGAADRAVALGPVELGVPVVKGQTLYVEVNGLQKQVTLAGSRLYGYLITNNAWTPAASTVFVVTLHTVAP